MAWSEKGPERMRRFKEYAQLEAKYQAVQNQKDDIVAELARKDAVIRQLAQALAELGGADAASRRAAEELSAAEATHTREVTGNVVSDRPGVTPGQAVMRTGPVRKASGQFVIRRDLPLSEQLTKNEKVG